jgi:hypothetical protein
LSLLIRWAQRATVRQKPTYGPVQILEASSQQ